MKPKSIFSICVGMLFVFCLPIVAYGEDFYVDPFYDSQGRIIISATEKRQSTNARFFVEDYFYDGLSSVNKKSFDSSLEKIIVEFESVIYPRLTNFFGQEWRPGIDNDSRITILIVKLADNFGGYFNANDEYARSIIGSSNEREMVYLNASYIRDFNWAKTYLAQELQHLIGFYQKDKKNGLSEDIWLNEGRSEYAVSFLGYNSPYSGSYLEERVKDFLNSPSDSLTEWTSGSYDYAVVNLFIQYLTDHYGSNVIGSQSKNNLKGIASMEKALADSGYSKTFGQIFSDWTAACYLNSNASGNELYRYKNSDLNYFNLHVQPSASYIVTPNSVVNTSVYMKNWSPRWYKFIAGGVLGPSRQEKLEFQFNVPENSGQADFRIPYIVTDFFGQSEVKTASVSGASGTITVRDFGNKIGSVVFIPANQYRKDNFSIVDNTVNFSFRASALPQDGFHDGDLVRVSGQPEVYIVKGQYKRWIQNPKIFGIYKHFSWNSIIDAGEEEINKLSTAWLVRAAGDYRVYEVNGDGTKHWLNMTAEQFVQTGHKWEMVYEINSQERDLYKTGADVMYKK